MNELDIKRLRQEAERDLDALKRVEAMLAREKTNGNKTAPVTAEDVESGAADTIPPTKIAPKATAGLQATVVNIMKERGPNGCRPRDVVAALRATGYPFKNAAVAASSVSTALKRLKERGDVEKKISGNYVWIGN